MVEKSFKAAVAALVALGLSINPGATQIAKQAPGMMPAFGGDETCSPSTNGATLNCTIAAGAVTANKMAAGAAVANGAASGTDTRFPATVTGLRKSAGAGSTDTAATPGTDFLAPNSLGTSLNAAPLTASGRGSLLPHLNLAGCITDLTGTTDQTANINACLGAAGQNTTIDCPIGTILISPVGGTLPNGLSYAIKLLNGQRLICSGKNSTTFKYASGTGVALALTGQSTVAEGFSISSTTYTPTASIALQLGYGTTANGGGSEINQQVRDVVTNFFFTGLDIESGTYNNIENVRINDSTQWGIRNRDLASCDAGDRHFHNITFTSDNTYATNSGSASFDAESGGGIYITNMKILAKNDFGVRAVLDSANCTTTYGASDLMISSSSIENVGVAGLYIDTTDSNWVSSPASARAWQNVGVASTEFENGSAANVIVGAGRQIGIGGGVIMSLAPSAIAVGSNGANAPGTINGPYGLMLGDITYSNPVTANGNSGASVVLQQGQNITVGQANYNFVSTQSGPSAVLIDELAALSTAQQSAKVTLDQSANLGSVTSTTTPTNVFQISEDWYRGATITITVSGIINGAGPSSDSETIRIAATSTGAAALTNHVVSAANSSSAIGDMVITTDYTSIPGSVLIGVEKGASGTSFTGLLQVSVAGRVASFRRLQ